MGRLTLDELYTFDRARVERFQYFLDTYIKNPDGTPFQLEKWQWKILANLFGSVRKDNGRRRYTKWHYSVPRKQGKTSVAAIVSLYMLVADMEQNPQVLFAACSRDQAGICFRMCCEFIERSPFLSQHLRIVPSKKEVHCTLPRGGFMKVMSSDAASAHGWSPSATVLDEVSMFRGPHMEELHTALTSGSGARKEPLSIVISTVGNDTNTLFFKLHTYAQRIQEHPEEDPNLLVTIYGADVADDWTDPDVWRKANPALEEGKFLQLSYIEQECREAKNRPEKQNSFRRLMLNQWTSSESSFFAIQKWLELKTDKRHEDFLGEDMYLAVDLSSSKDLTAVVGCVHQDGLFYIFPWIFTPEKWLDDHEKRDQQPYKDWHRAGHLIATPGSTVDQRLVRSKIEEICADFNVRDIAFDRAMGNQLLTELEGYPCSNYPQGFTFYKTSVPLFESLLLDDALRHFDNPVLNWNIENVAITRNAQDEVRPSKRLSRQRIDVACAAIMAVDKCQRAVIQRDMDSKRPPEPEIDLSINWI